MSNPKEFLFLFFLIITIGLACSDITGSDTGPARVIRSEGKVIIVDQTGKEWDVTHAESRYGMKAEDFQFGLGPFSIRPIQDPKMLSPGDTGYPGKSSRTIIGTTLNDDTRAYPLDVMIRHEIANETFGDTHVSIAYWPLVELTAVYSREIDGQILTLSASGWTFRNTFVLYDYETESIWYHLANQDGLTCVAGQFADRELEEFESTRTRWDQWKNVHPDSKFLRY